MATRSGRMRHYVTIQYDTSADGSEVPTWANLIENVPSNVVPVSGMENYRGQQIEATTVFIIETRYDARIKPDRRVIDHEGRHLNIISVINEAGRDRMMMVQCGHAEPYLDESEATILDTAIAKWTFAGPISSTVFDISGNTNNLSVFGDGLAADDGGSAFVASESDRATLSSSTSPDFFPTDKTLPFFYAGEFKVDLSATSTVACGAVWHATGSDRGWIVGKKGGNDHCIFNTSEQGSAGTVFQIETDADMVSGWNQVICGFDGSQIKLMLNGVHSTPVATTLVKRPSDVPFEMAKYHTNSAQSMSARNVAYWDRTLTQDDMDWLYNNGNWRVLG